MATNSKTLSKKVNFDFWTSANWQQGFTGKLDVTNLGKSLDGWTVEFEAPFEITNIWDAEIISREGNKYVLGNLNYNKNLSQGETETITFNATKVNGKVVAPQKYAFNGFDFRTSANWQQGFTGKLDVTNLGKRHRDGWTVEFEAPFEITNIWDAEIISREGNKYVLGNLDYNKNLSQGETETITFNATKVNGKVVTPKNFSLDGVTTVTPTPVVKKPTPTITAEPSTDTAAPVVKKPTTTIETDRSGDDDHLQVKGRFLYDANGDKVILRGIENVVRYGQYQGSGEWNDPYENGSLIDGNGDNVAELAKTGANATRLIGGRPNEFERALESAIDNNLWVSIGHVDFRDKKVMETIKEYEAYVTLHAQGEVVHEDENKWREDSIKAIKEIRALGYKAPIEITAGFYGQRFEMILNQGEAILNADPMKNVVFVAQAYSEIENRGGVTANLDKLMNFSAPVLVGASNFGLGLQNGYGNNPNTYKEVWDETYERDLGSFYWAWSDADYGDVVSSNRRFDGLTSVGEYLVYDSPANLSSHAPKTEFLLDAAVNVDVI